MFLFFFRHVNEKNFVGLSCSGDYISCGSENNTVVTYHKEFPNPAVSYKFDSPIGPPRSESSPFISAIAWKHRKNALIAANNLGDLKILQLA